MEPDKILTNNYKQVNKRLSEKEIEAADERLQLNFAFDMEVTEMQKKLMTVKELAEVLGVSERTVKDTAKNKGMEINYHPFKTNGGFQKKIAFTEAQATEIKIELQNRSKVAQNGFTTFTISNDLDMMLMQQKLNDYQSKRIAELQSENNILRPKAIEYDNLVNCNYCKNFRDTAFYLGLSQSDFMKILYPQYIYLNKAGEYRARTEYRDYFKLIPFTTNNGTVARNQLKITMQGLQYFYKKYGIHN